MFVGCFVAVVQMERDRFETFTLGGVEPHKRTDCLDFNYGIDG